MNAMKGFEHRTQEQQVSENVRNALRVLSLVPRCASGLVPHPVDVVAAELRNALFYLEGQKICSVHH